MNQLLEQLANTIKVPTDVLQSIVNNYPQLRTEYIIHKCLTTIHDAAFGVFFLTLIIAVITGALVYVADLEAKNDEDLTDLKMIVKAFKFEALVLIISFVIGLIAGLLATVLAPDIDIMHAIMNR